MKQQSGQNWTSQQFQAAWFGLAIAEAMVASQTALKTSADQSFQSVQDWSVPAPSPVLSQTLASDCTAYLPLTTHAARLSQHLLDSLHPRQPGLSWLDIHTKYLQSTRSDHRSLTDPPDQAVTLLPLWLLISDRPDAIAYLAQQIQATASSPNTAVCLTVTALTLHHLIMHPLNSGSCGYGTPAETNQLLHQLRADLESDRMQISLAQQTYESLYAVVTQAPTLLAARHLIHSLPVELHAIATALYVLTTLSSDFTQAIRCAHLIQPQLPSAIALTGLILGLAAPLSLPINWRTAVKTLVFPPTSAVLSTLSQTLWQAWAGAYIPYRAFPPPPTA